MPRCLLPRCLLQSKPALGNPAVPDGLPPSPTSLRRFLSFLFSAFLPTSSRRLRSPPPLRVQIPCLCHVSCAHRASQPRSLADSHRLFLPLDSQPETHLSLKPWSRFVRTGASARRVYRGPHYFGPSQSRQPSRSASKVRRTPSQGPVVQPATKTRIERHAKPRGRAQTGQPRGSLRSSKPLSKVTPVQVRPRQRHACS